MRRLAIRFRENSFLMPVPTHFIADDGDTGANIRMMRQTAMSMPENAAMTASTITAAVASSNATW